MMDKVMRRVQHPISPMGIRLSMDAFVIIIYFSNKINSHWEMLNRINSEIISSKGSWFDQSLSILQCFNSNHDKAFLQFNNKHDLNSIWFWTLCCLEQPLWFCYVCARYNNCWSWLLIACNVSVLFLYIDRNTWRNRNVLITYLVFSRKRRR